MKNIKRCRDCGERRPLGDFHRDARKADGHKAACKQCLCTAQAARWKKATPEARRKNRERARKNYAPKGRMRGEAHYRAILTERDVLAIRDAHAAGATQVGLAARYGVDRRTIYAILHGENWRHV